MNPSMVQNTKMAKGQSVKADQSRKALGLAGLTRILKKQTGTRRVPNAMNPSVRTVQPNPTESIKL